MVIKYLYAGTAVLDLAWGPQNRRSTSCVISWNGEFNYPGIGYDVIAVLEAVHARLIQLWVSIG